jgi:hypothetical protein
MNRVEILKNAIEHTAGDRNIEYGEPRKNLGDCAELWSAYLRSKYFGKTPGYENLLSEFVITAEDVAWLNVLQKMARTFHGVPKPDTYEDAAAFSAIAGECSERNKQALTPKECVDQLREAQRDQR